MGYLPALLNDGCLLARIYNTKKVVMHDIC